MRAAWLFALAGLWSAAASASPMDGLWLTDDHKGVVRIGPCGAHVCGWIVRVLDREKPAHTVYHICSFEPRMRVGFQCRIGIDAIVAGPAPAPHLGETHWDEGVQLGGSPQPRIGVHSRIGDGLRL